MSYIAQDGFVDWITGSSAPASTIAVPNLGFGDQYRRIEAGIRKMRGVRPQNRRRAHLPGIAQTFGVQRVPKATCGDAREIWNKWGKSLVKQAIARSPSDYPAEIAKLRALQQLGNNITCMWSSRGEFGFNDVFWPAMRWAARHADSLGAIPSRFELIVESVKEAAADLPKPPDLEPFWTGAKLIPVLVGAGIILYLARR